MDDNSTEYILLRTARENLFARGFLLRVDFVGLEQIENGTWFEKIPDNEKPVTRGYIQIDVISKIMMYIEDLVILAKSFIAEKQFYDEFLRPSSPDLGEVIKCFFDNIDILSDNDILKIMSWIDLFSTMSNSQLNKTIKKIQEYNVTKIRNLLKELKDFGESNHPIYKRFKHGGMPVISPTFEVAPQIDPLAIFDTYSIISVGNDPMQDIHIIPCSIAILERYKTLIEKIQKVLLEMIDNRIACIQRKITYVFPKIYPTEVSAEEIKQVEKVIQEYFKKHPATFTPNSANYNVDMQDIKDKIRWYFKTYS